MDIYNKQLMLRVWYDEFQMKQDKVSWFIAKYRYPYRNDKYNAPSRPYKIEIGVDPDDLELFKEFTNPFSWWLPKLHPSNRVGFYLNGEEYV